MITLRDAKDLKPGTKLYSTTMSNADGSPQRWRVNGAVKTWKRDRARVRVPLKYGLYGHGYLTEQNLHEFGLDEEEVVWARCTDHARSCPNCTYPPYEEAACEEGQRLLAYYTKRFEPEFTVTRDGAIALVCDNRATLEGGSK